MAAIDITTARAITTAGQVEDDVARPQGEGLERAGGDLRGEVQITVDPDPHPVAEPVEERGRLLRNRLDEVTGWIALEWRPAVRWGGRLLDLPALRHLLAGEPAPAWLRDDPQLRAFASEHAAIRLDSMLQSDCRPLAQAWQAGMPLLEAWIRQWRSLWPKDAGERRGMDELCRMLRQEMLARQRRTAAHHQKEFEALQAGLVGAFRRYSFLPAAAFLHLALTSLELNRLRGDLLVRRLFQLAPEPLA